MASNLPGGCFKRLLKQREGPRWELDAALMEQILTEAAGYPLRIVSVNGIRWTDTCIKGMIYFLSHPKTPNIEWEGGYDNVSSGIWIWSKPLFFKQKTKFAIILIDTRIFLNEQAIDDEVLFCEISLRMSSTFIINAMDLSYPDWPFYRFLNSFAQVLKSRKSCHFQCFFFLMKDLLQMTSTPGIIVIVVNCLLFYFSPIISKFSIQ
jgi:hypothetical protein